MEGDAPRLSLAQQIAWLEETAPVDLDPEDAHFRDIEGQDALSADPAAKKHYLEVGPSSLRKLYHSISDAKYDGVKATRRQLEEEEVMSEEAGGAEKDVEGEDLDNQLFNVGLEETGDNETGDDLSSEGDEDVVSKPRDKPSNYPVKNVEPKGDLTFTLREKREEDRKKGIAVSRQMTLWDTLLDARIRMQKTVMAANKLPASSDLRAYTVLPECQEAIDKVLAEAIALSDEMFELQEHLLVSNESITPPPRKRLKINFEETPVDYATYLQEATLAATSLEATLHPYLVQTLSKWSSKIQAVAPTVLLPSNRNAFSKGSQALKPVVQVIDEILGETNKLLARTQVQRSKIKHLGSSDDTRQDESQGDSDTFDDTDFYQQLLRDVIDTRGNLHESVDDWMAVQKQKKAKKKVDTKASKGRKLRYEVHEKLQNFMVPAPAVGTWHEEQIDELFASLLGRGFENSAELADNEDETEERLKLEEKLGEALKDGFRVFG